MIYRTKSTVFTNRKIPPTRRNSFAVRFLRPDERPAFLNLGWRWSAFVGGEFSVLVAELLDTNRTTPLRVVAYVAFMAEGRCANIHYIESRVPGAGSTLLRVLKRSYPLIFACMVDDEPADWWERHTFNLVIFDDLPADDYDEDEATYVWLRTGRNVRRITRPQRLFRPLPLKGGRA